jgi:hypothetical protein
VKQGNEVTSRAMLSICFAGLIALIESGCGGGALTAPPPTLSISTTSLADGMVTFPYSQTIQATGGVGPFDWSVTSGGLPHHLALAISSTNSVALSGTPDSAETASFAIQVRDAKGQSATKTLAINIAANGSLQVLSAAGQVPAGIIEIQGLSAGSFNPTYWRQNTLDWVPDVRMPMFAARPTSPYQNIYAPWALEQPNGWRFFYGGWDGLNPAYDEIYSTTTSDFLSFGQRDIIIEHGEFQNVNNVNVQQSPDGSMHMMCTGGQLGNVPNLPLYFSSPDGTTFNGVPEPYPAKQSDVISIQGYAGFSTGNFNGANVLLRDNNTWILYFKDWNHLDTTYRATAETPPNFQFQGVALKDNDFVNDVKKITVNGQNWYLMGLVAIDPKQTIFFSLSNDSASFQPTQALFSNTSGSDFYIVSVGFVLKSNQLLGTLYGASAVPTLDQNEIFARWLQKKTIIVDTSGNQYSPQGGYGPDRQWFQSPASGSFQGTILVYAEDGVTPLASGAINVLGGRLTN